MSKDQLTVGPTVAEFSQGAMRRWAGREALIGGDARYTYADLQSRVNRLVRFLKSLGVGRGDAVALLSANRPEVIVATQAAQVLGLRYTPLHPMGSEEDHVFILEDAEIDVLIVDERVYAERGAALKARATLKALLSFGASDFGIDMTAGTAGQDDGPVAIEARPEDICNLGYTGGTTGKPKGVVYRHRTVTSMIAQELAFWEWPQEVRFLVATPLSHAAGAMLSPTMVKGGAFYFQQGFDPEAFMALVQKERITATFLVPTMLYVLLDHPRLKDYDLSSLEMIIYGAAPMSPARLLQALDVFGPVLCQLYGQSEAPQTISYLAKADHDPSRPERLGSCGLPVAGNLIRLLDDAGNEVAPGEPGEICVRGPTVMDGYWKRPEENEKVFAGGWLHTGDIARADEDGYLYIVDRSKDMIISGGFNVFPREVEDCLAEHPAVAMSAVIGIPDEKWGEAVKAVVVLKPGETVEAAELIALVRDRKGVVYAPKELEFADSVPLTAIGKLDKKALRAGAWAGRDRAVG